MLNPRQRSGFTLAELIVALTIGGVVLALVSAIAFRQHRFYVGAFERLALAGELRETAALLPIDLRGASTRAGDIRPGQARDTSLEVRATIGSAVVCDVIAGRVVFAPVPATGPSFAAFLVAPQTNDTAWVLSTADTAELWLPRRMTSLSTTVAGNCPPGGPVLGGDALTTARTSVSLDTVDASIRPGAILRLTRPLRYSLYRASDGVWYLGLREWNPSTIRFNTVQPVTGAFLAPAGGGLHFRYFDSSGVELPSGTSSTQSIARIDVALVAETRRAVENVGAGASGLRRRADSVSLTLGIRNRR
jgi:prepilin-type N-terminal cleavage/methylation domain-containing protein